MKKVTIITGHYGSGKTNISVNLALETAKTGERVAVVDLDIVNPYFRTADFKDLFSDYNIDLITPMYANSNLDIPAISFDLERLTSEKGYLIIDVGGDDSGSTALGRYKSVFDVLAESGDIDMLYVINKYRLLTKTPNEAVQLMREIEYTARFKHTGIINNSNLGEETDMKTVLDSLDYADEVSKQTGLPIVFTSSPCEFDCERTNIKLINRYVRNIWE